MKRFLLVVFISLNVFAIDILKVSQVTNDAITTHRLWSDTLTWDRTAGDSLLILTEDSTSFPINNYNWWGVLGIYGWENTTLYYQTANAEVDFDSLVTWTTLKAVGASSDNPDIQEALSLVPSKLIRYLAIATGSTDALLDFQQLNVK
jgi:hypothetical protein